MKSDIFSLGIIILKTINYYNKEKIYNWNCEDYSGLVEEEINKINNCE